MLVVPSGQSIPNSLQISARSSSAVSFGLRMKATSVPSGISSMKRLQTVVLPVPTSPVRRTNPPSPVVL